MEFHSKLTLRSFIHYFDRTRYPPLLNASIDIFSNQTSQNNTNFEGKVEVAWKVLEYLDSSNNMSKVIVNLDIC